MAQLKNCALLVIDMQEAFRYCGGDLIPEINSTIEFCRSRKIPVIFTQHGHKNADLDGGSLMEKFSRQELIMYGSEKWKLMTELDFKKDVDILIDEKRRYDAFYGTILGDMLHQLKVETVIISGVMTNLCCETTARSAFVRDFGVIFLSDGTGTNTKQMHDATLLNIEFGFGSVTTCQKLRQII